MSGSVLRIALPPDFRLADWLAFQGRDKAGVAEAITPDGFAKGLVWRARPRWMQLHFAEGSVDFDAGAWGEDAPAFVPRLRHMLGLDQDVAGFEQAFGADARIGQLLQARRGLRIPQAASPFEALVWAITGQQISVAAALAIRRRLIQATDLRHEEGGLCHPDAAQVAALSLASLRQCGYSAGKAETLLATASDLASGALCLPEPESAPSLPALEAALLARRGIGPWTVQYVLLRAYAAQDASLHGDVVVRRAAGQLAGLAQMPDARATARWLADFSPWRALVAAHLWAASARQSA